jgi:hypothetical protein
MAAARHAPLYTKHAQHAAAALMIRPERQVQLLTNQLRHADRCQPHSARSAGGLQRDAATPEAGLNTAAAMFLVGCSSLDAVVVRCIKNK